MLDNGSFATGRRPGAAPIGPHRIEPDARVRVDVAARRVVLDGTRKQALETARNRVMVTGVVFGLLFLVLGGRLVDLTALGPAGDAAYVQAKSRQAAVPTRADIVDRNGVILATSLPTSSMYADPKDVLDPAAAATALTQVFPGLDREELLARLTSKSRFVWIKRNLTPDQVYQANRLGLPGLKFQRGVTRVYPQGRTLAHVLGLTDVDGVGIAGLEQRFDAALATGTEPLHLSIDVRVQSLLRDELIDAVSEFGAIGATGVVLDTHTGETLAMVSLPDFDPNRPETMTGEAAFNRATKGVYEMGSTFKLFTAAMALDSGATTLQSRYDATEPLRVARFTISDDHAKNRWLSVPEILVYSSNIGAARMALDVGTKTQRDYLGRFGLLQPAAIELPEVGAPLVPDHWRDINTMTISYGHGIAVSPMQVAGAVAAVVNGGVRRPATLLRQATPPEGTRVISKKTSEQLRAMMRLVVNQGTGRKADAEGYLVGGKTGTAEKQAGGGYQKKKLISSFVGAFPMTDPRYVVLAVLDEPKGIKRTFNYATGGWVAAPVVKRVVERIGPMLGMPPIDLAPEGAGDDGKAGKSMVKPALWRALEHKVATY